MKEKIVFNCLVLLLVLFQSSVYAGKRMKRFNCREKVEKAMISFQKRKYNRTKTILEEVKMNCTGHKSMDTAFYILGKADLETRKPLEARLEFEVLIQDFPQSPFFVEANYLLGVCSYQESNTYERDQVKTKEAIRDLEEFISQYPQSHYTDSARHYLKLSKKKLVKKEYENARFYERIDQFEAAIVYYKIIIAEFPDAEIIPDCRLALARNLIKTSRPKEANTVLNTLLSSEVNDEIKKRAKMLLNRLGNNNVIEKPLEQE